MSDLVERLRAKRIYGVFEIERQRHEAADEIERLTAAIMRIEAINDNPADFNVEIDEVCRPFTSTLRRSAACDFPNCDQPGGGDYCRESCLLSPQESRDV